MNAPARYRGPNGTVQAIQYRPDIPNCQAVARLIGQDPSPCVTPTPHDDAPSWWIDSDRPAQPAEWIVRHNDDVTVVPDDQFTQHYTPIGDANG